MDVANTLSKSIFRPFSVLFEGLDPEMQSQGGGIRPLIPSIGKATESIGARKRKRIRRNWETACPDCMSTAMLIWQRWEQSISQRVKRCAG